MATDSEIEKAFKILLGAGLDYPPTRDEIPLRVDSWCELLPDVPGPLLIQAAKDIAISGEKFPSVARIRKQAENVKAHNGTSAAPNHFKPLAEQNTFWYLSKSYVDEVVEADQIEPPPHPEFHSWQDAQAWQEGQRVTV